VTQVLTQLRYNEPGLLSIFGGSQIVIESPLIQELMAKRMHKAILRILSGRFGSIPLDIQTILQGVQDDARLDDLVEWAARCPDLEAFRQHLSS
jgi:hypothetical protein